MTSKVPTRYPTYIAKCSWDSTAMIIHLEAKNETEAWNRAWKKVSRMEGGALCKTVKIMGVR